MENSKRELFDEDVAQVTGGVKPSAGKPGIKNGVDNAANGIKNGVDNAANNIKNGVDNIGSQTKKK